MKRDTVLLWVLAAALLLAMALTVLRGKEQRSRHGYGALPAVGTALHC